MKLAKELARIANSGVFHTTLFLGNDDDCGIRIHLVPAKDLQAKTLSLVFVNGDTIIPLGYAWTVLLANFIGIVNETTGCEIDDFEQLVEDTAKHVRRYFHATPVKKLHADLRSIVNTLIDIGLNEDPGVDIGQMSLREYAPHMSAPHRIDLMVSAMTKDGQWNCNQRCSNCYACGQPQAETAELPTEDWLDIISRLQKIGIPQITFTGGEPTIRKDLIELIDNSRWFVTRLNTNGILLTPDYCQKLRDASLDVIQITLYSHLPEIHNKYTAGNWQATVDGIKNAVAAGLCVSVNVPLVDLEQAFPNTIYFLDDLGVKFVSCSGLIRMGGAIDAIDLGDTILAGALAEALENAKGCDMELSFTSPSDLITEQQLLDIGYTRVPACGACLSNMAIAPNGDVAPCQSWLGTNANLGNILTDPWEAIWEHPLAKQLRGMSEAESLVCPFRTNKF